MYNGLVLSGGGSKGLLQLGLLESLYENKKIEKIKYLAGCSVGSLLCVLLAIGYTPVEIITYFCVNDFSTLLKGSNVLLITSHCGLIDCNVLLEYLEKMVMEKLQYIPTFEDLYNKYGITFICPSYKINHKKDEDPCVYFSYRTHPKMHITKAACLSSNIPIVFTKSGYNNDYYIDGGVFDNFPVNKLIDEIVNDPWNEDIKYKIIGIKFEKDVDSLEINTFFDYVKHLFLAVTKELKYTDNNTNVKILSIKTGLSAVDFDIENKRKIDLFIEGKATYKNFFK
jgi:patatin-like phospholipase/acyl hydrolase